MPDTALIALISGGAAVLGGLIGGGLGYFGVRRQVEGQIEMQRGQHREDHFRHGQGVYHDFLESTHRFMQAGTIEPMDEAETRQWFRDFEYRLTAVHLFGADEPRRAAQRIADLLGEMMDRLPERPAAGPRVLSRVGLGEPAPRTVHQARQMAYEEMEDQILEAWGQALEAMRTDIGPDL